MFHKFKIGQRVEYSPPRGNYAPRVEGAGEAAPSQLSTQQNWDVARAVPQPLVAGSSPDQATAEINGFVC